jgi:DNA-binding PadR family transcriptional regulator
MKAEQLKGHLDALLLAVLETKPLHGYAIIEALKETSGGTFDLPSGTVYPALRRLEQAGLVEGEWSEVGGRRRRTYRLTARGRAALVEERETWRGFARAVGSVLGQPAT